MRRTVFGIIAVVMVGVIVLSGAMAPAAQSAIGSVAARAARDRADNILDRGEGDLVAGPQPVAAPTPSNRELARFDEVAGVFSVLYPRDFREITRLDTVSDLYGYTFSNAGGSATLAVGFVVMSASDMSDAEWNLIFSVLSPEMLIKMLGPGFEASYTETVREEGDAGAHVLHWEGEAADEDLRCGMRLEESQGVLALVALTAPSDLWAKREATFSESLASLEWSPDLVREQSPGDATTPEEVVPPSEDEDDLLTPPEDEEEPPAEDADSLALDDLLQPSPTPTEEAITEETDVVESDEVAPVSTDMVDFEDANGVFVISYPAEFEDVSEPTISGEHYVFEAHTADGSSAFAITFAIFADEALSDTMWRKALNGMVDYAVSSIGEDGVEVFRNAGRGGQHWIYLEVESVENETYGMYYIEESEGVVALIYAEVPSAEWSEWDPKFQDMGASFRWSASAAREVLESAAGPESEPTPEPTATRRPRPKPTEAPGFRNEATFSAAWAAVSTYSASKPFFFRALTAVSARAAACQVSIGFMGAPCG